MGADGYPIALQPEALLQQRHHQKLRMKIRTENIGVRSTLNQNKINKAAPFRSRGENEQWLFTSTDHTTDRSNENNNNNNPKVSGGNLTQRDKKPQGPFSSIMQQNQTIDARNLQRSNGSMWNADVSQQYDLQLSTTKFGGRKRNSDQRSLWVPCKNVFKTQFSPKFNSIGLPIETNVNTRKIIPGKLRPMETIEKSIGKAVEKWKMGSGGAASLSTRNSVIPDVASTVAQQTQEKDAAQQLSAAATDRKQRCSQTAS